MKNDKIVVIGSSNTDMVIQTKKMPAPGETVLGGTFLMNAGGKGANQAVAAAKLEASVTFVGCRGNDVFGQKANDELASVGIDTTHFREVEEVASGIATITVDESGENSIVVASGANLHVSKEDIDTAKNAIQNASVVLLQLEIPLPTVVYAAEEAHKMNKKVILNPAPFTDIPTTIFPNLFAITPNETEAFGLTNVKVSDEASAKKAAEVLFEKGVSNVIITMGAQGAYLFNENGGKLIPTEKVKAVDTTAAGDTFNGAFASAIAKGKTMEEAIKFANKAGALSVTKMGAQQSCPTLKEVEVL
ncbi:ribokinase [Galbibacter mesophilus]|uniref:ribokinase n=1 Tax=Galbibacter mesophilus TaxID=379069 RepID=UPI00191F1622|nr:ribokinase [Galbibacter mesophilus]MCM5663895.1 ribokinase [Galbibacter mesophilus]